VPDWPGDSIDTHHGRDTTARAGGDHATMPRPAGRSRRLQRIVRLSRTRSSSHRHRHTDPHSWIAAPDRHSRAVRQGRVPFPPPGRAAAGVRRPVGPRGRPRRAAAELLHRHHDGKRAGKPGARPDAADQRPRSLRALARPRSEAEGLAGLLRPCPTDALEAVPGGAARPGRHRAAPRVAATPTGPPATAGRPPARPPARHPWTGQSDSVPEFGSRVRFPIDGNREPNPGSPVTHSELAGTPWITPADSVPGSGVYRWDPGTESYSGASGGARAVRVALAAATHPGRQRQRPVRRPGRLSPGG